MAGGVPEVMLHLRRLGLLELGCLTASGDTLERTLDWWEGSERRLALRERLLHPERGDEQLLAAPRCFLPREHQTGRDPARELERIESPKGHRTAPPHAASRPRSAAACSPSWTPISPRSAPTCPT